MNITAMGREKRWGNYRLLNALDRLAPGDIRVMVGPGNEADLVVVHRSWIGTAIRDCPEGVYLRVSRPQGELVHRVLNEGLR